MKKEFIEKVKREQIVDTKNYRYRVQDWNGTRTQKLQILRLPIEDLGTTAAIDGWEVVYEEGDPEVETLAERIRKSDTWDPQDCERLCSLARLEDEWEAADDETFETVIYKAAEILGVEVI